MPRSARELACDEFHKVCTVRRVTLSEDSDSLTWAWLQGSESAAGEVGSRREFGRGSVAAMSHLLLDLGQARGPPIWIVTSFTRGVSSAETRRLKILTTQGDCRLITRLY